MPQGLQVWGADGSLWVDTNTRLARIYGNVTLGPGNDSEALTVLASQGTPFCIATNPEIQTASVGSNTFYAPTVGGFSFSGTTLSVNFAFANFVNPYVNVYYGAY